MGRAIILGRRAFVGAVLAVLPTSALARMIDDEAPTCRSCVRGVIEPPLALSYPPMPYSPSYGLRPLRVVAQLHSHTTRSDGAHAPAEVVDLYRRAGYGAVALTDHDVVTPKQDGTVTPILGTEISPGTGHVGCIGADYERGTFTDTQAIIDGIVGRGGMAILNHPNWVIGYSDGQLARLSGYLAIEVFNAVAVGLTPGYRGFAVDKWDRALTNVRTDIWGVAADDFHKVEYWRGHDLGRTIVFAASSATADVLDSLRKGCFVADAGNYGVMPGYPLVDGRRVAVDCPGATSIRFVGAGGRLLSEVGGPSGEHAIVGTEKYVRIEAVGDYVEGFDAELDWTQRWGQVGAGSMAWRVSDGTLQQTESTPGPKVAWLKPQLHGDLEVKVSCRVDAPSRDGTVATQDGVVPAAGVGFNAPTQGFGYALAPDLAQGRLDLLRYDHGVPTRLGRSGSFTMRPGQWYTVRVRYALETGRIQARCWPRDAAEPTDWAIDALDGTYREGAVYLECRSAASFDDLYVRGFKTYYQPVPVAHSTV